MNNINARLFYKPPKVTKKVKKINPEWNSLNNDLSKYKLTTQEIMQKKIQITSKNLNIVKIDKIVEKQQKELSKLITRSHSTNFQKGNSNLSESKHMKLLNESKLYLSQYRFDSSKLNAKKLSMNQSFSKSDTKRLNSQSRSNSVNSSMYSNSKCNLSKMNSSFENKLGQSFTSEKKSIKKEFKNNIKDEQPLEKIKMNINYQYNKTKAKKTRKIPSINKNEIQSLNTLVSTYRNEQANSLKPHDYHDNINNNSDNDNNKIDECIEVNTELDKERYDIKDHQFNNFNEFKRLETSATMEKKSHVESLDECMIKLNSVLRLSDNIVGIKSSYNNKKSETPPIDEYNDISSISNNDFAKYSKLLKEEKDDKYDYLNEDSEEEPRSYKIKNNYKINDISQLKDLLNKTNKHIQRVNEKFINN